jgi:hypothetical protein
MRPIENVFSVGHNVSYRECVLYVLLHIPSNIFYQIISRLDKSQVYSL